jgi:ABC-type sugar transport system substrate-binding protein
MRSRLALAGGATAEAVGAAEQALASARSERNEDPVTDRYRVAAAYLLLGDVWQRAENTGAAAAAWRAGLSQLPGGVVERPADMGTRAELLSRLGRGAEARPLAARLAAIGYRNVI